DDAIRRAASAHARAESLEVLDLVPGRLASWRALILLATVDPARFRRDRFARGCTAGDALLVSAPLLARLGDGGQPRSAVGPVAPPEAGRVSAAELRPTYERLLARGTEHFFEPPRPDCPLCGGGELAKLLEVGDHYQRKPGRFALWRCRGCGHVFQNPRLSLEGLAFYYRDFYDGLGEELTQTVFGNEMTEYRARAGLVMAHAQPRRWLD